MQEVSLFLLNLSVIEYMCELSFVVEGVQLPNILHSFWVCSLKFQSIWLLETGIYEISFPFS